MRVMPFAAGALVVLNLISFGLMAYDKHCARAGRWRIPEKILFMSAACFGGLGGVLCMRLCRHKTRHLAFRLLFPLMLAAQAALLVLCCRALLRA